MVGYELRLRRESGTNLLYRRQGLLGEDRANLRAPKVTLHLQGGHDLARSLRYLLGEMSRRRYARHSVSTSALTQLPRQ